MKTSRVELTPRDAGRSVERLVRFAGARPRHLVWPALATIESRAP